MNRLSDLIGRQIMCIVCNCPMKQLQTGMKKSQIYIYKYYRCKYCEFDVIVKGRKDAIPA